MNIELLHVNFSYGGKRIFRDLSITLTEGIYGLLGPNGAGKSTLMNLITTLRKPSSGTITVNGVDVRSRTGRSQARTVIGYLPQRFELMEASSVIRNVQYATWARGLSWRKAGRSARWALRCVGLTDESGRMVHSLSGGMRQRVGIACAIAAQPDILILDEPTVGLDPIQRIEIRSFLNEYAKQRTVLVSTHMVEDLAAIADRIIVLNAGRILLTGTIADLAAHADPNETMATPWESGYRHLILNDGAESLKGRL